MSCAACVARVEKAAMTVDGVTSCAVNLLTHSMGIEGDANPEKICAAIRAAGYGARLDNDQSLEDELLRDTETPKLRRRLIYSIALLIPLVYIAMGGMLMLPTPPYAFNAIIQLILATAILIVNRKFFTSGLKGLLNKAPNMDTLVALGSGSAYLWSIAVLIIEGGSKPHLHFESAAMILTLITVGKTLEAYSKGRTTNALKSLLSLAPDMATVIRDGDETTIPAKDVKINDIFIVLPGDRIPVDGIVAEGFSAVDEAALTGESIPVEKAVGDPLNAATLNKTGYLKGRATRVGNDTTISQIIKMVADAAATKAPIAKAADKASQIFVPAVLIIALITLISWLIIGDSFEEALTRAVAVLVISCPCALGLATPVAIMVGSGVGAKQGILFKTSSALESAGRIQIAVLDKTGTITNGEPIVTEIIPANGITANELLSKAAALEDQSRHPLAMAISQRAHQEAISLEQISELEALPGNGLKGLIGGNALIGGKLDFISQRAKIPLNLIEEAQRLTGEGKTVVFFAEEDNVLGLIALIDAIKPDGRAAIKELQEMGIRVVMLTGDNERTANTIAREAGVDKVVAGVLPNEKANEIKALRRLGRVAMVGDGINDAPALTEADIGIAIGAGSDVAIDAAEVVLVKSHLRDVPAAIRLGRATLRNIKENLFWAFLYNILLIPLAAGCWTALLGWKMHPALGALAMGLSSVSVVGNALRLNLLKLDSARGDKKARPIPLQELTRQKKENITMTKTLKVEGMMCPRCEAHVKKALEAIEGVSQATADHKTGSVTVVLEKAIDDQLLIAAITDAGYDVIG